MIEALRQDATSQAAAEWLRQRLPAGARLTADSREVRAGDAFFAWPGGSVDGRRYCPAARAAGAAALVVEAEGWAPVADEEAVLPVPELRRRAGPIASAWLGQPSAQLTVVAVTGTNGKTSCTHWIAAGCNARAGAERAALIGTLGAGLPGRLDPSTRLTTPDALQFQQVLARFAAAGIEVVAIEASSIGLVQHRLEGTRIAVAVLTNLSRDHLDVHGTMQAYAQAKARLFAWPGLAAAVVNLDDPAAAVMLDHVGDGVRRIGYTLKSVGVGVGGGAGGQADVTAVAGRVDTVIGVEPLPASASAHPGEFVLVIDGQRAPVRLGLLGGFNRANALAVAGVWHALGWPIDAIAEALAGLEPVPGRLQMVGEVADLARPLLVIDYAHTPDALSNVLEALRPVATARGGRLWCLFGAGGDRDRGKRPVMSRAAAEGADFVVLTSDNPRSEDPLAILADLEAGLATPPRFIEADRRRAIERATRQADGADVILLAGKGHEDYQEIAGVRHPFSDLVVARAAYDHLAAAGKGSRQ